MVNKSALRDKLGMNLQFFAENPDGKGNGGATGGNNAGDNDAGSNGSDNTDGNGEGNQDSGISIESLMAENAKLKVEITRNKTALDKALKNAGELTKQLRAKMSAAEQEEEAKREAEEAQRKELNELKEFRRKAEARERYLTMGMSAEFAKQAADAEVKGDMDAFAAIMKQYTDASVKAHEAEWLKNRPDINAGHGDGDDDMAKIEKEVQAAMGLS